MNPELNRIYLGDNLGIMRTWPGAFIQTCVTSPPYWGLRDYGVEGQLGLEATPDKYVAGMVEVFREVRRLLRDDGTLWLNLGDSYTTGASVSPRSGDPKAVDSSSAMVPRRGTPEGLKPKDLVGIPWMVAFALRADGWYLRSDIIWHKPNPMPESVTDRPTKSHEYIFLLSKSEKYHYDHVAIKEKAIFADSGIDSVERGGFDGKTNELEGREAFRAITQTRNKRTVWTVNPKPYAEAHFATFPDDLIEPCILAGSPKGGLVLDPFMGAGTTALVAARHSRNFLGCELNPAYIEIAEKRIAPELAQGKFL